MSYAQSSAVISDIGPSSVKVSWQGCSGSDNAIRFRAMGTAQWIEKSCGETSAFKLSNLKPKTHYEIEVKSCASNKWSPVGNFRTIGRPNIVVIYADDGRYDNYTVNGGPAFFQSPNINRIAEEGVNFKYCFPALSLCSPSRASIVTGLYPHHHAILNNAISDPLTIPTIATILQDSGYHTGFVGKYGFNKWPVPGYSYWLESSSDQYWDTYYSTPTGYMFLPGHKTDRFTDAAKDFLNTVPTDSPFCLILAHHAPHVPLEPRWQDSTLYLADAMPFPSNFYNYSLDFPSYLYDCHNFAGNIDEAKSEWRSYYQLLAGVEWSVGKVLDKLDNMGVMDSTLIIYTSDNGLLKGEHILEGKQIALDESLRLPMFIRYPKWFNPDSSITITDEMAMNIDIAPTMLDAAGITSPVPMDGWSMHDLVTGAKQRKEFLYEYYNKQECTPTMHGIRSFDYIYIKNACDSITEEFYDLVNDSSENQNQINVASYQSIIQIYRHKLDSIRAYYGDTIWVDTLVDCQLMDHPIGIEDFNAPGNLKISVFPNPGDGNVNLAWSMTPENNTEINVIDIMGRSIFKRFFSNSRQLSYALDLTSYPDGIYFIIARAGKQQQMAKYVKHL